MDVISLFARAPWIWEETAFASSVREIGRILRQVGWADARAANLWRINMSRQSQPEVTVDDTVHLTITTDTPRERFRRGIASRHAECLW
jgi:hypothetical protein